MKKRTLDTSLSAPSRSLRQPVLLPAPRGWAAATNAQGPQRPRTVSVELAKAERKSVPVDVDANGTVTPISSVALKSRLETTIVAVHFEDGAKVNEGDLLFTLDSRQIDAQIEQAEGVLARDQAQLEGAQRDLRRFTDLVAKGATTQVNVDNARTQSDILAGSIKANQAALDNLKVQKSYTMIRAPFSGRISVANVKVGNFVRPADTDAACRHQPDGAGLCDLRGSAARAGRSARVDGERGLQRHRDDPGPSALRDRQGRDGRKHGGCDDRHGHRARHHGQRERDVVAGNPGRDQARHPQRRFDRGADGRRAAQPERQLRLRQSRTVSPRFSRSRSTAPRRACR